MTRLEGQVRTRGVPSQAFGGGGGRGGAGGEGEREGEGGFGSAVGLPVPEHWLLLL